MSVIKYVEALGHNKLTQTITFSNEAAGAVSVFTVTGDVLIRIIPVITTDLTSAAGANIKLGVVGETDAMIVDSLATDLDARGIWVDQTPDHEIEPVERIRGYIVTNGNDVILTLDAQIDTGVIAFYCFWTALSTDGQVVNA